MLHRHEKKVPPSLSTAGFIHDSGVEAVLNIRRSYPNHEMFTGPRAGGTCQHIHRRRSDVSHVRRIGGGNRAGRAAAAE